MADWADELALLGEIWGESTISASGRYLVNGLLHALGLEELPMLCRTPVAMVPSRPEEMGGDGVWCGDSIEAHRSRWSRLVVSSPVGVNSSGLEDFIWVR